MSADQTPAAEFLPFVDSAPSPYHATAVVCRELEADGFVRLHERDNWAETVKAGGNYYVTRNESSLVAFSVGGKYTPGDGFCVVAAHTDSPCLRIKPISKRSAAGFHQVGVETYGGGLWYTWFDRDLTVAGRVLVEAADGSVTSRLVHINRPILRIPSLAIHLNRGANDGFKVNAEKHLAPILCSEVKAALQEPAAAAGAGGGAAGNVREHHHPALVAALAEELGVDVGAIMDFELVLCDTQAATIGGLRRELVQAPRLDNLMMSYTAVRALRASQATLAGDATVRCVALFDNEEVGSRSEHGAESTLLREVMERLSGKDAFGAAARRSLVVSADMAHALHPNYTEKHEAAHGPRLHAGLVIKHNANQRYSTTAPSALFLRRAAAAAGQPLQEFVVRQDMGCGSTIGPAMSTGLGIRTVDTGIAQYSMHSIRECCGTDDVASAISVFTTLFDRYGAFDAAMSFD